MELTSTREYEGRGLAGFRRNHR